MASEDNEPGGDKAGTTFIRNLIIAKVVLIVAVGVLIAWLI